MIVDDLKPAVGTCGHSLVKFPNVDRLTKMGIQLNNAHCSFVVCGWCRSPLFAGVEPEPLGVWVNTAYFQSVLNGRETLPYFI